MTDTFIQHCITVYESLQASSITKKLESGENAQVFVGKYAELWTTTGVSRTYYSSVKKCLEKHNAIVVIQRGGRDIDTVIVLRGLPEVWDVDGWRDGEGLTTATRYATLSSDVQEIKKSLGGLNVVKVLSEFEKRVIESEKKIVKLEALNQKQSTSNKTTRR